MAGPRDNVIAEDMYCGHWILGTCHLTTRTSTFPIFFFFFFGRALESPVNLVSHASLSVAALADALLARHAIFPPNDCVTRQKSVCEG